MFEKDILFGPVLSLPNVILSRSQGSLQMYRLGVDRTRVIYNRPRSGMHDRVETYINDPIGTVLAFHVDSKGLCRALPTFEGHVWDSHGVVRSTWMLLAKC